MRSNWDEMVKALIAFKAEHGHCNVSACDGEHRRLGQWVSSQRYKRRVGTLSKEKLGTLDGLGFTWSASDQVWQSMYDELVAYAKTYGTTNIPERYDDNQKLSNWVHNQRHRKKIGRLDPERVRQLDELGFCWAVRANDELEELPEPDDVAPEAVSEEADSVAEERLYLIRGGLYVQYGGTGRRPQELARYAEAHGGDDPAYIPLPKEPVEFTVGNEFFGGKRIPWCGKGPLPETVMAHVRENGTLPRYEPVAP